MTDYDPHANLSKTAHKLIPSNPSLMVIRDILPNVTTLSVPFLRFGRLAIGGRATVVRLQSGSLAVFNPVGLTPEAEAKILEKGGQVKYLAALDIEHHIFLGQWTKRWPEAEVIGMAGLPEKRDKDPDTKGTTFKHIFSPTNKLDYKIGGEFDQEFKYEYVDSHVNKEIVFYHVPTSTLIEADLLFNLPAKEQYSKTTSPDQIYKGVLNKIFNRLNNTQGDALWQKRFLWYLAGSKDRNGMAESVKRIDAWGNVGRIIPAHGDVIEGEEAGRVWRTVFAWFREGQGKKTV